jgi:peptidoglycan/xylan/chitin deacetylase (PgdA/CDA1 family)/GT2 family glycosyltransferase
MAEDMGQIRRRLRCSVVVTTWHRPIMLRNTLASLQGQSYSDFEVVVVCDGDDPGGIAISREFEIDKPIRWVFHPVNRGLPAARNTGAREATGDILLFLDDDVIADPNLVSAHMSHHLQASPGQRLAVTGLTGEDRQTPLSTYLNERLHEHWKSMLEYLSRVLSAAGPDSVSEEVQKIICFGLNGSIRRDLFLACGGFNELFRASDEQAEFGIRLYQQGFEFLFEPRALLTHKNSKDLTAYYRACWRASGSLDVYRVLELGEKNAQTRNLVSMYHGNFIDRLTARMAWHSSGFLLGISKPVEHRANRSRSSLLWSVWAGTVRAGEYWNSVKSDRCTLAQLKQAAGAPRCALAFHSLRAPVSESVADFSLAPERFEQMMRWFIAAGHKTATLAQWREDPLPKKHVLLTFDDGCNDLYERFLPFAIQHHLTAVIFLVAGRVGGLHVGDQPNGRTAGRPLTWPQIREMQKYGIEFGSHSLTHPHLPDIPEQQLRCELAESKRRIEDALGVEVTSFAYPYGGVDRRVRSAVAEADYKLAFTSRPGPNGWNDLLCQWRNQVSQRTSLLDFAFLIRTGYGFRQSISNRLGATDGHLPSSALHTAAGVLRSFGQYVRHDLGRSSKPGDRH